VPTAAPRIVAALLLFACEADPGSIRPTRLPPAGPCDTPPCDEGIDGPCLEIDPVLVDFGEVRFGEAEPLQTLTIHNRCAAPVEVRRIAFDRVPVPFVQETELTDLLWTGLETKRIDFRYVPTQYSEDGARLTIEAERPEPDALVAFRGRSVCDGKGGDDDLDGVPDGCDVCQGADDRVDRDGDGVPDGCDACAGADDALDADGDTVPDACDRCEGADDTADVDGDTVPDACDACALGSDFDDADMDLVADACDVCPGGDDRTDVDGDTIPDACDTCASGDDRLDADLDTVPDACEACPGNDDRIDADGDRVPDGCDVCPGDDDRLDEDGDSIPNGCDTCDGDDTLDRDADSVPDACDACPGFDDALDEDGNGTPDGCDPCFGVTSTIDSDGDGVPDECDQCPGASDALDADGDDVPDACDACPAGDDRLDIDGDGVADACDRCPSADDTLDADLDAVPDACDACPNGDDRLDGDGDGVADACDACGLGPDDVDSDGDLVPDACDACDGFDDSEDADQDGIPDACGPCVGVSIRDSMPAAQGELIDIIVMAPQLHPTYGWPVWEPGLRDFVDTLAASDALWRLAFLGDPPSQFFEDYRFMGPIVEWSQIGVETTLWNQVEDAFLDGDGHNGLLNEAYLITRYDGDGAPGAGFLRTPARLAFLTVVEQPGSIGPWRDVDDTWRRIVDLKGGNADQVSFTILGAEVTHFYEECKPFLDGPAPAWWTHFEAVTGTEVVPICDPTVAQVPLATWGSDLANAVLDPSGLAPSGVYPLTEIPVVASLEVFVDGVPDRDWVYDEQLGAIVFDGDARPADGALIEAVYSTDCDASPGACSDGIDNDADGLVDHPAEPGCRSPWDATEADPGTAPACANAVDDDADGFTDHPGDDTCDSAAHVSESCVPFRSDAFGYRVCREIPAILPCPDLSGTSGALSFGTEEHVEVSLGFEVDVYGHRYAEVNVGQNGLHRFGDPVPPGAPTCLPANPTDATLAVWWDDLDVARGNVWTSRQGATPDRRLAVQWRVPVAGGSDPIDVRAVIHEGGDIDVCYVDTLTGDPTVDNGASATAGLQGNRAVVLPVGCGDGLVSGEVLHYAHP